MSQKITLNEIVWAGSIDPISSLIPRTAKDVYANGRRKFSDNVPIRKPGEETTSEISNSSSSRKLPPMMSLTSTSCGQLVAVFVPDERTPQQTTTPSQTESLDDVDGEASSDVFEEHPVVIESCIVPRWVLRFPSKAAASVWLKETQTTETVVPSTGRIWMVTELAEVYWTSGTALDSNQTWFKVCFAHFMNMQTFDR